MIKQETINALKADAEYLIDHNVCDAEEIQIAIQAVEKTQKHHKIKERLQAIYGECDCLLETFIDHAVENAVAILEKHEGIDIGDPYQSRLLTDEDVDKWEEYKAIGTPEEIKQNLAELKRWHTAEVNPKIKNVFANTSTLICHNCDHKDEYIEELEAEIEEYREIGTPEECSAAMEKQKAVKPLYRHYEDKGSPSYIKIACPNGCNIQLYPVTDKHFAHEHVCCPKCGQKIDWGDEDDN